MDTASSGYDSLSQDTTGGNRKSVQEVSKQKRKQKKAKWPKTSAKHWEGRLFKNSFTRNGVREETADWCVKIGHKGHRETFNLETPNAEAGGAKALSIYLSIVGAGWDEALAKYKPKAVSKPSKAATIGMWLEAVEATSELRPSTFTNYAQCLRQIAAEIEDIGDQPALDKDGKPKRDRKHRPVMMSRFDYKKGGREAWITKINSLPLSVLSAQAVQRWKIEYIARVGDAPDARRRAENSAASLMRCARSLFSEKCRRFAPSELVLPEPLPFVGVELPRKGGTAYQSKINASELIQNAQRELTGEPFKIFVLGLFCGLRKREIDLLLWSQIDFDKNQVRIERTKYFEPKTEDAIGTVDMDEPTAELLRKWKVRATGEFVIESSRRPRHGKSRANYRCTPHFRALYSWLRDHGVNARKPLHELRKELGALLASQKGIFAAQTVLRHAQISTTAAYYTDKKRRITAGLGALLTGRECGPDSSR